MSNVLLNLCCLLHTDADCIAKLQRLPPLKAPELEGKSIVFRRREGNMSLRKRRKTPSEDSDPKDDTRPPPHRPKTGSETKTGVESPCILISDSDGEDSEENGVPRKRPRLQLARRRTGSKRKIAQMTEEEQFALALKISEREVNHTNYSPDEENEILRKAIEESLHSCRISDIPKKVPAKQTVCNEKEDSSDKEDICSAEHDEKLPSSQRSSQGLCKSPMVHLTRLSQDIVESSSIILSPNGKDLFSQTESEARTPRLSNTSEFVGKSLHNSFPLSPVFPRQSPSSLRLAPRKLFLNTSPSELHEDIDDQLSHCSESSQPDSASLLPNSPSRPMNEESLYQNKGLNGKGALCNGDSAKKTKACTSQSSTDVSVQEGVGLQQCEGSVHYYWGVPFCPKGVDPNVYSQVILCQLEVYQKSLKRAQRQLLNKMDFGEPIDLPVLRFRQREDKTCGSQDGISQECDDLTDEGCSHKPAESEEDGTDNSENSVTRRVTNRRRQLVVNKIVSPHNEENSSATQEEPTCSTSQTLFPECVGDYPVAASASVPSQTDDINGNSPAELNEDTQLAEEARGEEEEITVCPETQPSPAEEHNPEMEKVDVAEARSPAQSVTVEPPMTEELEDPQDIQCPMCSQQFSSSQILMHAAYCEGPSENDKLEMSVLRSSHRLSKRNLAGPSERLPASDSGKYEECYLCHTSVQRGDYRTHVDKCMEKASLETPSSRRLRSTKPQSKKCSGSLLSMLDKSEAGSAGAHRNVREPDYMRLSPPREEKPESVNKEHGNLSDSPIRSFVAISEAKDCLVDFKGQFSRQPGGRGHRNQAKGRSRKR
uniref:Ubiquitin interaction motif containing 1 n=1 Tax=Leptobrachium leishanense TaxID=445787 RepID=A0A8C5PAG2_9ANUR